MTTPKDAPMRQIISQIPVRSGLTRDQWGTQIIGVLLAACAGGGLSAAETEQAWRIERGEFDRISPEITKATDWTKLDQALIKQTVTLGPRMLCSQFVLFRLIEWQERPEGLELSEQFCRALARSYRIVHRRELPPIDDPGLREHKRRAVPELKVLLREMRTEFSSRSLAPDSQELADWFLKAISDNDRFPMLAANPEHWAAFLKDGENADALKLQLEKRLEPAALFNSWLGWLKGHDPEYLRKKLASLSLPT